MAISGGWGETQEDREKRYAETARREARIKAGHIPCYRCEKEMGPGEPVWRQFHYLRADPAKNRRGGGVTVVTACQDHKNEFQFGKDLPPWRAPVTKPCGGCGRDVSMGATLARRYKHWWCSLPCRGKAIYRKTRATPESERQKICSVCGEEFTAQRTDAKTCGSVCRQKAYRQRKSAA